jgi:L-threonylcarbamoyladenylate synthase
MERLWSRLPDATRLAKGSIVVRLIEEATALEQAVEVLAGGGLAAIPTETVYGLAADASNGDAVARIFEAKGRPAL